MFTSQSAVDHLYQLAIIENKGTSTQRLQVLAGLCVQELDARGVRGARCEVLVPGMGHPKQWDVAWEHGGRVRLGISLKSLLRNLRGTVPNRIDDLVECVKERNPDAFYQCKCAQRLFLYWIMPFEDRHITEPTSLRTFVTRFVGHIAAVAVQG